MKVAILGAGAMGSIYGANISKNHDVYLIDTNEDLVSKINTVGLKVTKDDVSTFYYPKAFTNSADIPVVDVVIVFVKALYSKDALLNNKSIIGKNTILMTLQNGQGHEELLREFVSEENIIIGTTEDNGRILGLADISHGGNGNTNIGSLVKNNEKSISIVKEVFEGTCFNLIVHENISQLIWDKLFINSSLSVLTGVLQVKMGFIAENDYAFNLAKQLILESTEVAKSLGLTANYDEIVEKVRKTSSQSKEGITSICADIANGRKTEVDTISGAVVKSAKKCGLSVPTHETMVNLIHALEQK